MTDSELYKAAEKAREFSYCPYSGFAVGAALETKDGEVFTGCNIENSSFGVTNCAERTALFKAVSEGKTSFAKIAVCGGKKGEKPVFCTPCGVCRQALSEFCGEDFRIILFDEADGVKAFTLPELLPFSFGL